MLIQFVPAVLATWRISHLLTSEGGPAGAIARLRARLNGTWAASLTDCFGCTSIWVAVPLAFYVAGRPVDLVLYWLALSGGAFLLERASPEPLIVHQVIDTGEKEINDGMLRPPTVGSEPAATGDDGRLTASP